MTALAAGLGLAICGSAVGSAANSGVYGGGPLYNNATDNINELKNSGFTEAVVWNIFVSDSGDLNFNGEFPLCSNGSYVGDATHPDFASNMALLKQGTVKRITFSVGSSVVGVFQSIKGLVNAQGTGPDSVLYKNFQALKLAVPSLDAIDFDDENCFDQSSMVSFSVMLADLGYKVSLCPFSNSSFWTSVASEVNHLRPGAIDSIHLQCYSGGSANNPDGTWNFGSIPVYPGLWDQNLNALGIQAKMTAWKKQYAITGGWVWLYDDFVGGGRALQFANAINNTTPVAITNAYDVAANYSVFSGNFGTGFGPWVLSTTGGGALMMNGGFNIWNNTADASTTAVRPFTSPLAVGGTFSLNLRFGSLSTSDRLDGFQLQDAGGNVLFSYSHAGMEPNNGWVGQYTDAGGTGSATAFAYNYANFSSYTFQLNSATTYTFIDNNTSASFTGTLSGAPISQVLFFRTNGSTSPLPNGQDFAFDALTITSPVRATTLTLQPLNSAGFIGGSLTLKSLALSTQPLSYQWHFGSSTMLGATNANLTLTNLSLAQAGNYYVVASTASDSVTSTVAVVTVQAHNDILLAYEGFDYAAATSINTLNGGSGWGVAWNIYNGGPIATTSASLVGGLIAPPGYDAISTGVALTLANNSRATRVLDCSSTGIFATNGYINAAGNIGVNGTTLYISFLAQSTNTGNYCELELHRNDFSDNGRIGGIGCFGGGNITLRTAGTLTPIGAANTAPNLYVMRVDFHGGSDDVRVYRNPTSATEPGTPTLTKLGASDMSFNSFAIGAYGNPVAMDEIRVGTTWQKVMPVKSVMPVFNVQPLCNGGALGSNVTLTASVLSLDSVAYQWYQGTAPIAGATGASLVLSNLSLAQAGNYWVVAMTPSGSVTSVVSAVSVYGQNNSLLTYEGFDYGAYQTIGDISGGAGWGGPWTMVVGDATTIYTAEASLIGAPNSPEGYDNRSRGMSLMTSPTSRAGRFLDCSTNGVFARHGYLDNNGKIGADGKTIYISFLQQPGYAQSYYEFELHRGSFADANRIGGIGNDLAGAKVNLRTAGTQTAIGDGDASGPNLYVVRIDFKAGNDDVRVYRNPTSITEPGTPTLTMLGASDMSFDAFAIGSWGNYVAVDEIRVGTTWEDALGMPVAKLLPLTKTAQGWNVNFAGTSDFTYRIQSAGSVTGPWTDIGQATTPESAFGTVLDTNPAKGQGFYRAVTP